MKSVKNFTKIKGEPLLPHLSDVTIDRISDSPFGGNTLRITLSDGRGITIDWDREMVWSHDQNGLWDFSEEEVRTPKRFLEWLGGILTSKS